MAFRHRVEAGDGGGDDRDHPGRLTGRADARGLADAVAVGRPFLANPDLPARWRTGAELNEPNPDTFYGGGAEGYTDYPFLDS